MKWIEFPDGGVTRGGHGERDVEAAEELLKRGLNFVNDNNNSDGRGASEERIKSSQ